MTRGTFATVYDLEIITGTQVEDWVVHYYERYVDVDGTQTLSCFTRATGAEVPLTGVLHVNTTETADLAAFHGRLDAVDADGTPVTIEF